MSSELFGEHLDSADSPLAELSQCRCASKRVTIALAKRGWLGTREVREEARLLLYGLQTTAANARAEHERALEERRLALEERRVKVVEDSAAALQERNRLKEEELRILEARRVGGGPGRLLSGPGDSFETTLRRLAEEEPTP